MPTIKQKCEKIKTIIEYLITKREELEIELSDIRDKCPHLRVVAQTTNLYQLKVCMDCGLITQRTPKV